MYSQILLQVQPLRDELASLCEENAKLQEQLDAMNSETSELMERISLLKREYATLIRETEAIKQEMDTVAAKCDRSTTLLESLSGERQRWEAGSTSFRDQMATLAGDSLVAAAFITYAGILDHSARTRLLGDWQQHLSDLGIPSRSELSLVEYLSTPSQRLSWHENSLPSDALAEENALLLERFNRYPLVIDPAGQALSFLQRHYAGKGQRVIRSSFLDNNFVKQLESALRFGQCLLVEDVDRADPLLNPVLNRELQRQGGRVLIRVGNNDIDFAPSFAMFLATRDPECDFPPDLCSRVTFVNFTVTPSSLTSQCLGTLLESECPEVEHRRRELLKLQGEYAARLRELEEELLAALNGTQGNILDDDSVIQQLETLKAEAASVALKQGQTEQVMAEVEASSNRCVVPTTRCMCTRVCLCKTQQLACNNSTHIHTQYTK